MFSRRMLFLPALAAAAGVPYFLFGSGWSDAQTALTSWSSSDGDRGLSVHAGQGADDAVAVVESERQLASRADNLPPLEGKPVRDLREILNFNISKAWITSRWARVSTTLAEQDLEGMRVAVVTGPKLDDIAGSLTYYFDDEQRVQRLTLQGTTGDPRRLVAVLQQQYGFRPEPTSHAGLYLVRWNGVPRSGLLVTMPPVVTAQMPHARYNVKLEINLPSNPYRLSAGFSDLLQQQGVTHR